LASKIFVTIIYHSTVVYTLQYKTRIKYMKSFSNYEPKSNQDKSEHDNSL